QRADAIVREVDVRVVRLFGRFLRRDQRETREAIVAAMQSFMCLARNLAADLAIQRRRIDRLDEPDAAARAAQRVDRGRLSAAEAGDDSDAGDGDARHDAGRSDSTMSIMSPNVFIARARSSGMEILNSSSMPNRIVSASSESIPASARLVSGVRCSSGIG